MFHKAIALTFLDKTTLEVTFQTGEVKSYDVAALFGKYPQLRALEDRNLFLSGKLMGAYGIVWSDELDLELETVYEDGQLVRQESVPASIAVGNALLAARARAAMSQVELAAKTGIDQADISRIERGLSNPSIGTLQRLAVALGSELKVSFEQIL